MANEVRLIDGNKAEAVLRNIADHLREAGNTDLYPATCAAADVIKQQRTIDPESLRPKGRWEKHWCDNDLIGHMYEVCPNCRSCEILDTEKFWDSNFCPNCGAQMEG